MSRYFSPRSPTLNFSAFNLAILVLVVSVSSMAAPPEAISYQDALRLRQMSLVTDDWSETKAYDIENPVEIEVVIQGVELAENGYAVLHFLYQGTRDHIDGVRDGTSEVHRALLQSTEEFERLRVSKSELSRGTAATLIGWHQTRHNYYGPSFLVDAIVLKGSATRYGLHDENKALRERVERGQLERAVK